MTFQAYLDTIEARTGKTPADFRRLAEGKGFLEGGAVRQGVKAGEVVAWLAAEFGLGRGHAMAIWAMFTQHPAAAAGKAKAKVKAKA